MVNLEIKKYKHLAFKTESFAFATTYVPMRAPPTSPLIGVNSDMMVRERCLDSELSMTNFFAGSTVSFF